MPESRAAAAHDLVLATIILIPVRRTDVGQIPVGHPLRNVAAEIAHAIERDVAGKRAHRRARLVALHPIAGIRRPLLPVIAPGVFQPVRSARRLFPFGLARQAFAMPAAVGIGIMPAHRAHRQPIALALDGEQFVEQRFMRHLRGIGVVVEIIRRDPAQIVRMRGPQLVVTDVVGGLHPFLRRRMPACRDELLVVRTAHFQDIDVVAVESGALGGMFIEVQLGSETVTQTQPFFVDLVAAHDECAGRDVNHALPRRRLGRQPDWRFDRRLDRRRDGKLRTLLFTTGGERRCQPRQQTHADLSFHRAPPYPAIAATCRMIAPPAPGGPVPPAAPGRA